MHDALHVHTKEAETFVVIDGALEGWCGGRSNMVEAGSLIHLPAGSEHAFKVARNPPTSTRPSARVGSSPLGSSAARAGGRMHGVVSSVGPWEER